MYKLGLRINGSMFTRQGREGETLERQLERKMKNKEPLEGSSPLMYTERRQGVMPGTNIRTDRWEIAVEASDKIAKSYKARRDNKPDMKVIKDGETKSIQGKSETDTAV